MIRHILRKIPPQYCPVSLSPFALSLSKGERFAQDRLVEGRRHAVHASTSSARTARKFSLQFPYNYGQISKSPFTPHYMVRGSSSFFKRGNPGFGSTFLPLASGPRGPPSGAAPGPEGKREVGRDFRRFFQTTIHDDIILPYGYDTLRRAQGDRSW